MAPPIAIDSYPTKDPVNMKQPAPLPIKAQKKSIFDPAIHLNHMAPKDNIMMSDIGLEPSAISKVAATHPFQLLSEAGVIEMRKEIFSPQVLDNCMYVTRPGSVQIRGMAPRYAPFIHEFWNSAEVLQIMSENAGVDLVPCMDYEISHTNVSTSVGGVEGVRSTPIVPPVATESAIEAFKAINHNEAKVTDQAKPVIEWHKDSHPFVCVVMLSDARNMVGGETEMRSGGDSTIKVKAPQMGCAAILQGRYIEHTAGPATNMPERVTVVTSFRPRDPTLRDETTNANIRNKSNLNELYYQWATYRLDVLSQRAAIAKRVLEERYRENVRKSDALNKPGDCKLETVNVLQFQGWCEEQIAYLQSTMYEMRPLETINGRVW